MPSASAAPRVITGVVFEKEIGEPFENTFAWSRYATLVRVPPVLIFAPFNLIAEIAFKMSA